ncbi:MAG: Crp/Fnr family transcriptional regulator [Sandarakinorhabdus sp.]|nr:Crp/Fnr family transcriptional regulator [Sandarakinorhabdus sp.]
MGVQRRLARGETLVRAGDPPLVCANVQSGVLKVASMTAGGSEAIVGLAYPGDFIGRPFAQAGAYDVVALNDVELCVFSRAVFERAIAEHSRMERLLLRRMLAELDRARGWMVRMGHATASARVAGFLDDMRRRIGASDCRGGIETDAPRAFDLPLSRGEIADLLGLTIETVSRQMTRLRAAGIIDLPGGRAIVVRLPEALAQAAAELN